MISRRQDRLNLDRAFCISSPIKMATLLSLVPSNQSTALVLPLNSPIDISYAILRNYVHQLRDVLHNGLGVRKGDVVAMSYVNSLEFVVAFFSTGAAR
jgi:acyl-CoA synthetase (AMP-forming)/AMP-acid ligase II